MNPTDAEPLIEIVPGALCRAARHGEHVGCAHRVSAPHAVATDGPRLPLNLGIVLDRSGSMAAENKLGFTKQAADHMVRALADDDTVSLVIFDEEVKTLMPSVSVGTDRKGVLERIAAIVDGGSTDLHGGWLGRGHAGGGSDA